MAAPSTRRSTRNSSHYDDALIPAYPSGSEYNASDASNMDEGRHEEEQQEEEEEEEDKKEYGTSRRGRKIVKHTYVESELEEDADMDDDTGGGRIGGGRVTRSRGGGGRQSSSTSKAEDLFADETRETRQVRRSTRNSTKPPEDDAGAFPDPNPNLPRSGRETRKSASRYADDDDDDEEPPRRILRSRPARNLTGFIVSDEDSKSTKRRSERKKAAPNGRSSKPSGSNGGGRITRRSGKLNAVPKTEEEDYVDNPSAEDDSADADGSDDDAPRTSEDELPDPVEANGDAGAGNATTSKGGRGRGGVNEPPEEEGTDGKPYALRQRQKINYAIPPPLEELSRPPGRAGGRAAGGGGRGPFGGGGGARGHGAAGGHGRAAIGKPRGLGWSASGAELGRWMGMPADDSDSDHATRSPRKQPFGLGALNGAGAAAGGAAALPGTGLLDLGAAAGAGAGTVSNLGKIGDAALADVDPLGVNQNVTFEDTGGLDDHIKQLKDMTLLPLLYPELFIQFKITPPRGVLFHGPPGTGKTLLARALAASCRANGKQISFFMRKGADCLSKWVGEAERQLRLLFEEARASQPSIIFFDEIDGLAPVRSSKQDQIHASIVSTLLALMDGMDGRGQVVVIGATNRPDAVDPALRRPGRFDREFYFGLPGMEAREKILGVMMRGWQGWCVHGHQGEKKEDVEGKGKGKEKEKVNVILPPEGKALPPDVQKEVQAASATTSASGPSTEDPVDPEKERLAQEEREQARARIRGLAKLTKGYGGADLRALCTEAALNAVQRRYPQIYKSTERLLVNPESVEVRLKDFMIAIKNLVPSSARSSTSAATPLPTQFVPLLGDTFEKVREVIGRVMPVEKRMSALDEAEWEDEDESGGMDVGGYAEDIEGGREFQKELAMQSMQSLRVYRPRVVLHGDIGMGQGYIGAAALHHLEGFHVQSLELGSLMGDSTRTVEAAIVQLFVEAKRHQPSVIYIPSLMGWCAAVSEASRSTVRAMLDTLAPTDPILLLAIVDGPFTSVPRDVRAWFGAGRDNRVVLPRPTASQRQAFFEPLLKDVQRKPTEFPDGVKRKKRVLEVLPVAPPIEPRKPTEAELMVQEESDMRILAVLKYRLGPILTELKRKWKRFTKRAAEEYDYDFNAEDVEEIVVQQPPEANATVAVEHNPDAMNVEPAAPALVADHIPPGSMTIELHEPNGIIEIVDGPSALNGTGITQAVNGLELDVQPDHAPFSQHQQQSYPHQQQVQLQLPPPPSHMGFPNGSALPTPIPLALPPPTAIVAPPPPAPISVPRPPRLFDMDLERMHTELYKGRYLSPQEFLEDVGKIVHNAEVRAYQDPDRFYKAQAMYTAAEVSILEFDPQLKMECERMAGRERQRRNERRKKRMQVQMDLRRAEERAGNGKVNANGGGPSGYQDPPGVRRSARHTGQEPEMQITDPVKLERRLKRQREDGTGTGTESHQHSEDEQSRRQGTLTTRHGTPVVGPLPVMMNGVMGVGDYRGAKRARTTPSGAREDDDRDPLDMLSGATPGNQVFPSQFQQHQQHHHQQQQHSQQYLQPNMVGYAPTVQDIPGQPHQAPFPGYGQYQNGSPVGGPDFSGLAYGQQIHGPTPLNAMPSQGSQMIVDGYGNQGMGPMDPYQMHQQQQGAGAAPRRGFDGLLNPMSPTEDSFRNGSVTPHHGHGHGHGMPHSLNGMADAVMMGAGQPSNMGYMPGPSHGHGHGHGQMDGSGNSFFPHQHQQGMSNQGYPQMQSPPAMGMHMHSQQQSTQPASQAHHFSNVLNPNPTRPSSTIHMQMSNDSLPPSTLPAHEPSLSLMSSVHSDLYSRSNSESQLSAPPSTQPQPPKPTTPRPHTDAAPPAPPSTAPMSVTESTPPPMSIDVIERIPTPLPDFHVSESLLGKLGKALKDDTAQLTVEQLEQLRATCLATVWRHRKEWDRDELVQELIESVKEFVLEVRELMEEDDM